VDHHADAPIEDWAGEESSNDGVLTLPHPRYHGEVRNFITALGKLLRLWTPVASDYQEISSQYRHDADAIETAGPDEVKALLTFVFQGENFLDGF